MERESSVGSRQVGLDPIKRDSKIRVLKCQTRPRLNILGTVVEKNVGGIRCTRPEVSGRLIEHGLDEGAGMGGAIEPGVVAREVRQHGE